MNLLTTMVVGGCAHALIGAGIFFAKEEPYKVQIFIATIIKGLLVALLIGFSLQAKASQGIWVGVLYGAIFGLAFGFVIFLAKGADFKSTPHVLSGSIIQGIVTGGLIVLLGGVR
jgi:hypothetical protein